MKYTIFYRFYSPTGSVVEFSAGAVSIDTATRICAAARQVEYQAVMPHDVWMAPL
jgi:hypothetical protein